MAFDILKNVASIEGMYGGLTTTVVTPEVSTNLISGFTATKTADKELWANGYLTYTIVITNSTDTDLETPVLKDNLDPTLVALVADSVKVGGVTTASTYDDQTGDLSVPLTVVEAGGSVTVTFQVTKNA